jgi:glycosyltransferase involved in cell wall biosynthesis
VSTEIIRPPPRPLRVGLNLVFLGEQAGGAGRYAAELPGALLAAEPETEVHVFVSRDAPQALRDAPWGESVRWITLPIRLSGLPAHVPAQFLALPPLALARRLDVLHSPANTGPVLTPGVASVVSLLDLIWLHRSAEWEASPIVHRRMRMLVGHCVRHAERIFAISQAAAEDFVRTLGVARERIEVTPLGVRPVGRSTPAAEARVRGRLELVDTRVLLCVAQKRPYKNLHRLVRALPELEQDVVLVLPGSPTAYESELRELASELGVMARVRFPDWISDEELDALYGVSSAFVLPSLIEGFGIPVLEAMAHGVPVACSNVSALPEVVGDAALLFDPESQQEVVGSIRSLLADRTLAERLIDRGHERAAGFTWKRTGAASLAGYRRAIAERGSRQSLRSLRR